MARSSLPKRIRNRAREWVSENFSPRVCEACLKLAKKQMCVLATTVPFVRLDSACNVDTESLMLVQCFRSLSVLYFYEQRLCPHWWCNLEWSCDCLSMFSSF